MAGDEHVNYDFGAAEHLKSVLSAAHKKVNEFVEKRGGLHRNLLGDQPCEKWDGGRRDEFDHHKFHPQQQHLKRLAEELQSLIAKVDAATEDAQALVKRAHAKG